MGCSQASEEDKISSMKRKLEGVIYKNDSELKIKETELAKLEMKIVQYESDIVQNQFILNELELKRKARDLAEVKKDKIRKERERNQLAVFNDTMKNNLQMMESKIQEYRNAKSIEEANSILNDIYKMDFSKTYNKNIDGLLKCKQQNEENMRILEAGNNLYLNDNDNRVESPDEILNNLRRRGPAPVNNTGQYPY